MLACLSLGLLLSCEDKAKDVPDWRDYMKSGDEEQIAVAKEKIPSAELFLQRQRAGKPSGQRLRASLALQYGYGD